MKFLKSFIKEKTKFTPFKPMSEQDMVLLAFMCGHCRSMVVKKGLFRSMAYAYYVPVKEEYISIAQELFVKSGINMVVHNSAIMGENKQNVLRIKYKDVSDKSALRKIMNDIQKEYYRLYVDGTKDEISIIEQRVATMKQR